MKYTLLAVVILLQVWGFLNAEAGDIVSFNSDLETQNLTSSLIYKADTDRLLDFHSVLQLNDTSFTKITNQRPVFGFTGTPYWFKISLMNSGDKPIERAIFLGNSMTHSIDLYQVNQDDSVIAQTESGAKISITNRPYQIDDIYIPATIYPGKNTFYVLVSTKGVLAPEFVIAKPNSIFKEYYKYTPYYALLIGVLLFSILYNVVIFGVIKDTNYLVFFASQLFYMIVVLALSGLGAQYIWEPFTAYTNSIHRFSLYFGSAWSIFFTARFLETKNGLPKIHYTLLGAALFYFISSILTLFGLYQKFASIATLLLLVVIIVSFIASLLKLKQGYKPARFFLLSKGFLLVAVFINFLTSLQIIPYIQFLIKSHFVAGGLEAILISFALADRIKLITFEAEKAKNAQLKETMRAEQAEFRAKTAELQAHAAEIQAKAIETENQRKTQELEQARTMQTAMLPKIPPFLDDYDVSMYMKTATEVGGDYYDFFPQDDNSLLIAFGDASGHGLSAGVMVTISKTALTFMSTDTLNMLMEKLNKGIHEIRPNRMNMAMRLLHLKNSRFRMSTAAMPDIVLWDSKTNSTQLITQPGLPLGAIKRAEFDEIDLPELHKDSLLVLVSDGIIEHKNSEEEEYGYDRLQEVIRSHSKKNSDEVIDAILKDLDSFAPLDTIEDDLSFLIFKRK
ncbi:hypothetical protein EP331_03155 [bacterium]|nr:MAG: hypothetical protein EP331_03155 [bacterium]